jgi:SpoIID/LytB domain protein
MWDLARASRGVTVRIGSPGRGRDALDIPLELYVAQVLSAEGEPNAPEASAQALAVAIRTYALFNAGRHQKDGFDLCDTTHCQVLRASSAASRRAAQATLGLVLTYQGTPADLYYSASCGGHTERASDVWPKLSLPYLEAVEDDVTTTIRRGRSSRRSTTFVRAGARRRARRPPRGRRRGDAHGSGRWRRVGLPGLDPASMNSNDFRLALGSTELRSTAFTWSASGDRVTFTGAATATASACASSAPAAAPRAAKPRRRSWRATTRASRSKTSRACGPASRPRETALPPVLTCPDPSHLSQRRRRRPTSVRSCRRFTHDSRRSRADGRGGSDKARATARRHGEPR